MTNLHAPPTFITVIASSRMHLIRIFFLPRVINTLDELPEPEEMLCVHPETTLREWAWSHERLLRFDDTLDPEP